MNAHRLHPGFVMDITVGDASELPRFITPRDQHLVEDVISAMGKAAAAYLAAIPDCDAYALRVTAIPVRLEETP